MFNEMFLIIGTVIYLVKLQNMTKNIIMFKLYLMSNLLWMNEIIIHEIF